MRLLLKPLQILYVLYAFLLFIILMIPVFIWSLLVLPLGRIRSGNLIYKACIVWADIWFFLLLIRHKNIYIGKKNKGESYIFVSNHNSNLDSAIIPKTFRYPVRPLGKVEMAKIPVFGFIYKKVIVTVDRSSSANRTKSVQVLKSVLRKGISVLVFPEGTFNTTHQPLKAFYDGAFRIAIETRTPVRPVLFLDTYDRLNYTSIFSLNPGKSRSLFLPPVSVEGFTLKDIPQLRNTVIQNMESALIQYKASWIKPPVDVEYRTRNKE
ncbi:MAG TPA: lysophospholipid acyltransferase family protein [Flavisolibacter sp.]|nr:lysophospholipid acyltransferase family protein [Flavisolibacter sp.]